MKRILSYLGELKKRLVIGLFIKIVGTVAELFIPFILTYILEKVIVEKNIGLVVTNGVLMAFCAVVACVGNTVANRMAAKTTMLFSYAMRRDLFYSTLSLGARATDEFTIPSLESRITSDTYNVQNFIGMMQRMGVRAPMLLLGGTVITFIMDKYLALVMLITLPIIFVFVYSVSRKGVPLYSKVQKSVDGMVRVAREDVQGIRVIKALSKNDFENRRYDKVNRQILSDETYAGTVMSGVNPIMTMLMNLGIVAVVLVSAHLVSKGMSTPAKVIAFMQYFTLISMAMMSLSRMFVMYTKCAASAARIAEVIDFPREKQVENSTDKGDENVHISFKNVSFSYLGAKDNLSDLSFDLKKGQHLGIIGATGSGKSTVIKLLLRLWDTDKGNIYINGKNIKSYEKEEFYSMFGTVFQNGFIYADTIEENIKFGREATRDNVKRAAEIAQAHEFISALPDAYSHVLSQNGTNLSGGQRQRVLIARALLTNPEILILDDASSALDYKTDANLRACLDKEMSSSTIITVAQRVSSVKNCDLIIVLDEGKVIGMGTHEQLLSSCSEYENISKSQMGGAIFE